MLLHIGLRRLERLNRWLCRKAATTLDDGRIRSWMVGADNRLGRTRIVGCEDDRIVVGIVGDGGTSGISGISGRIMMIAASE